MNKNILAFDIESTGLELHKAKIITISFIFNGKTKTIMCKPDIPIPIDSTYIHGINDDMVQNCKPFSFYAKAIYELCCRAEWYLGYNIRSYDIVLLKMEMLRAGYEIPDKPIIDVYQMLQSLFKSLKLKDIYRTLFKENINAHNSESDIEATFFIYNHIIEKYLNVI